MKKYCLDGEIASFDYHDETGLFAYCGPRSLKAFLSRCKPGEDVEIEINSPGGSVIAGVEMANAIKNSSANVTAHVVGIAASMASVIACACDEIVMEEASFMMIHDPWGEAVGNADEMRKEAKLLDQMKDVIMSFYRGKFSCPPEKLSALMSDETWYTGAECLENGLACTVVASDVKIAAKIGSHNFAKMPEAARAFYDFREIPDEVKAAIEAAKAEAAAPDAPTVPSDDATPDPSPAVDQAPAADPAPAATAQGGSRSCATDTAPAPAPASSGEALKAEAAAPDWEARYKGASKKITELSNQVKALETTVAASALETVDHGAVVAERDQLRADLASANELLDAANEHLNSEKAAHESERDSLKSEICNLKSELQNNFDQVKAAGYEDLAALLGAVSGLKADLEKSGKDLAETREHLDHLRETQTVLTAGVLTPPTDAALSYDERMKKARTVDDREALRALKKAGKIK